MSSMNNKPPAETRNVVRGIVREAQDHEVAMREARKKAMRGRVSAFPLFRVG